MDKNGWSLPRCETHYFITTKKKQGYLSGKVVKLARGGFAINEDEPSCSIFVYYFVDTLKIFILKARQCQETKVEKLKNTTLTHSQLQIQEQPEMNKDMKIDV